jgi:hypothetical protein
MCGYFFSGHFTTWVYLDQDFHDGLAAIVNARPLSQDNSPRFGFLSANGGAAKIAVLLKTPEIRVRGL